LYLPISWHVPGRCSLKSSSVPDSMKHYAFRDAEFTSAREKGLVLKAWVRFLKSGLRWEHFSDRLYKHLINHCSFIAYYNRNKFYAMYFTNGEGTLRFLSQFDKRGECRSVEYGESWWCNRGDYEDVNGAMIEEGSRYIPALLEQASAKVKAADLAEARRLSAKHGFEIQPG
jgi:hypothetical protein